MFSTTTVAKIHELSQNVNVFLEILVGGFQISCFIRSLFLGTRGFFCSPRRDTLAEQRCTGTVSADVLNPSVSAAILDYQLKGLYVNMLDNA